MASRAPGMVSTAEEFSRAYLRRDPGSGVLFEVLASHLETFLARSEGDGVTPGLPRYVVRELRAYLDCGVLARGFARFHCFRCGTDALVAFSCKGRGFCPSCGVSPGPAKRDRNDPVGRSKGIPDEWRSRRRTWWITSFPRSRCASG